MRVLLTGGAGYIGSHTAVALVKMGYQVVLYDNFSNSKEAVVEKIQKITGEKIKIINGDVRNYKLLRQTMLNNSIEGVLHFAGLKSVGESIECPISYYSNNIQGTISLVEAMSSLNIKNLVFSSSATVYGVPKYLPLDECHPVEAINPYGRTKLHIEEMLKDIAFSDASWKIAGLRYFNPVGAHESGLIGEKPAGTPNNLMPYISAVASGKIDVLNIFGDDYQTRDGTGVRDYIHIMDLAEGHVSAMQYLTKNTGYCSINLGTGRGYSVLELVAAYEKVSSRKIHINMSSRRVGDVAECYADSSKAAKLLDWVAKRTIEDMCSSSWNFYRKSDR